MPLTLTRTAGPTVEPVTVSDLKSHLRIDISDDDFVLYDMIQVAREDIEQYLRRQILTATWKLYLDRFPRQIRLPRPPVQSVTSIQYKDTAGATQTLAASVYQTDLVSEPPRVMEAEGKSWPSTQSGTYNTVIVTYVAGWTTIAGVPRAIRIAIQQLAGDLYEHRESRLDMGGGLTRVDDNPTLGRLLWRYRVLDMI